MRQSLTIHFCLGVFFGVTLIKSEVASWFRIQEMFRFDAFHMYGVIGSALAVAAGSVFIIRRLGLTTSAGEPVDIATKTMGGGQRYAIGGVMFGVGWALTGACPGPIFALIGSGVSVMVVVALSAIAGAWVYGYLRPWLPH